MSHLVASYAVTQTVGRQVLNNVSESGRRWSGLWRPKVDAGMQAGAGQGRGWLLSCWCQVHGVGGWEGGRCQHQQLPAPAPQISPPCPYHWLRTAGNQSVERITDQALGVVVQGGVVLVVSLVLLQLVAAASRLPPTS